MSSPGIVKPTGIDITTNEIREVRKGYVSYAVQTGSNDNSALADAIAAIPNGGVIELGAGSHYLDNFQIPTGVMLVGVGAHPSGLTGTVIKPSGLASGNPVVYATGSFKMPALRDLTIDTSGSASNPAFKLIGSAGTSGLAFGAHRCWFYNASTAMSAVGGRFGALTECDGSASWGEIIAKFDDCGWNHGGASMSNMYVRTTNLHLQFLSRKMLMGYGGKNIDCEASGWIKDDHPYRACNGPVFTQSTAGSAYKTITVSFVSGSRSFTVTSGTLGPEDTRHNAQASAISGTGVWIAEVTDSTHGKLSAAATSTTSATMTIRRNTFSSATVGLCDYHIRGSHGTINVNGGDDEGILELFRYEAAQYGGIINLSGVYAAGEFHMISGLCYLNLSGPDLFNGFINSEGGSLVVNADPVSIGGYQGGTGPQSYGLLGTVEKPVMLSRRDGTVIFSKLHAYVQDYNRDTTASTLRVVREDAMPTTQYLDASQSAPTNPVNGALHSDIASANGVMYRRGGIGNPADPTKGFFGGGEYRRASDGWTGHANSQDAAYTGGSPFQMGDFFEGAIEVRDFVRFSNTDTEVTRGAAGDLNVAGKRIYRVDGTDVAILDGGTGASDAPTARTNLGLGTAATHASGDFLQPGSNLSDVSSAGASRHNLGVGTADTPSFTGVRATSSDVTNGGIGYPAGGGVGTNPSAQATRSTDMTINALCGLITTGSDSLANGATATFKVTNSAVKNADIILFTVQQADGNPPTSWVRVYKTDDGHFWVATTNTSGGADTNAYYFRWSVWKNAFD